jgi:hypothetical protein
MKKLILIVILLAVGWQTYTKSRPEGIASADAREEIQVADASPPAQLPADEPATPTPYSPPVDTTSPHTYTCDGRTYCSQMHSCEEATFFLRNCPDVKMDGNHDGVPCEMQWCK